MKRQGEEAARALMLLQPVSEAEVRSALIRHRGIVMGIAAHLALVMTGLSRED